MKSVIIGNGVTDFVAYVRPRFRLMVAIDADHAKLFRHLTSRYDIACGTAALSTPPQDISACVAMKNAVPRCKQAMQTECVDGFDHVGCGAAVAFCESAIGGPFRALGESICPAASIMIFCLFECQD